MLFNSVDFFVFFAVVVAQYFPGPRVARVLILLVGLGYPLATYGSTSGALLATGFALVGVAGVVALRLAHQESTARKLLLTVASFLFYSAWRWPFTSLLVLSTLLDYTCAREIGRARTSGRRRFFLLASLVGNLGLLGTFKYANFFVENVETVLRLAGLEVSIGPLPIILPLGISFYTFQTMSYTIDVYRRQCEPRESMLDVVLYVSFFPQLVAGPILRATEFLPQLEQPSAWDSHRVKSGVLLMIAGLSKKLLIADALAPIVNQAYGNPELYSGPALLLATYCFAFQIYCDFSGYSDIAIGAARVLGFEIPLNFNHPYFAPNITVFWRRWHISLSTWLRDYLYISLGGSRGSRGRTLLNLMATMLLGGLWHGASWNFVIWGGIHGVALVCHKVVLWGRGRDKPNATMSPLSWLFFTVVTFHLVCLTWVFFRAPSLEVSVEILGRIFGNGPGLMVPFLFPAVLIPALLMVQAFEVRVSIVDLLLRYPRLSRFVIFFGVALLLAVVGSSRPSDFIYFVF